MAPRPREIRGGPRDHARNWTETVHYTEPGDDGDDYDDYDYDEEDEVEPDTDGHAYDLQDSHYDLSVGVMGMVGVGVGVGVEGEDIEFDEEEGAPREEKVEKDGVGHPRVMEVAEVDHGGAEDTVGAGEGGEGIMTSTTIATTVTTKKDKKKKKMQKKMAMMTEGLGWSDNHPPRRHDGRGGLSSTVLAHPHPHSHPPKPTPRGTHHHRSHPDGMGVGSRPSSSGRHHHPPLPSHLSHRGTKKHRATNQHQRVHNSRSRDLFVLANGRFLVSDANDVVQLQMEPDVGVHWGDVARVTLTLPNKATCPISLESPPWCPQITPCGHVFACSAITQHLFSNNRCAWCRR